MEGVRSKDTSPWLLSGAVNLIFFLATAAYLSQLHEGLFSDISRSAVIEIYAVLATVWTAILGYVIWVFRRLGKRTRAPLLTFFLLLAALDIGIVTAVSPGIWGALWRSNPYWSGPWGYLELEWLVGSTAISGALYLFIRSRSVAQD
ncbi:MAG TPA: hypothetical protein VK485_09515 [Sphingomicrobium sp.]|nr:hypothetical protein [Sphingomicrobium sp.]